MNSSRISHPTNLVMRKSAHTGSSLAEVRTVAGLQRVRLRIPKGRRGYQEQALLLHMVSLRGRVPIWNGSSV